VRRRELKGEMGGSIIREILLTASELEMKLFPDSEMNVTQRFANGLWTSMPTSPRNLQNPKAVTRIHFAWDPFFPPILPSRNSLFLFFKIFNSITPLMGCFPEFFLKSAKLR
jgi:hypothetical protein